ncbi:MAG: DUF4214 domain-containing protein, partial [Burkholderiaceae bacterium]|nr:DUF4214 domain-containing protein [Burkholderiaceae bacterium]
MSTSSQYAGLVQELYVAYLGRPADYYGLQNFEAGLAGIGAPTDAAGLLSLYGSNAAVKSPVDAFGTSAESQTLYGHGSVESFVSTIYQNLFNRPANVAGLTFWTNAIDSGQVTRGEAALAIAAGAEGNTSAQGLTDAATLANKLAAAEVFTSDLGQVPVAIPLYVGASVAEDARLFIASITANTTAAQYTQEAQQIVQSLWQSSSSTYVLTPGNDNFQGSSANNLFVATLDNAAGVAAGGPAQTLGSGDTIAGGTYNNTLAITDYGTGGVATIPSGATITGMTALEITSQEGMTLDLATWNRLSALQVNGSNGEDSFTVGINTIVSVNDSMGDVSVTGGLVVNVAT